MGSVAVSVVADCTRTSVSDRSPTVAVMPATRPALVTVRVAGRSFVTVAGAITVIAAIPIAVTVGCGVADAQRDGGLARVAVVPPAVPATVAVVAHSVAEGDGVADSVAEAAAVGVPVPFVAVEAVIGVAIDVGVGVGVAFTVATVAVGGMGDAVAAGATVTVGVRVATGIVAAVAVGTAAVRGRGVAVMVAIAVGEGGTVPAVTVPGAAPTAQNGAEKATDANSTGDRHPGRGNPRDDSLHAARSAEKTATFNPRNVGVANDPLLRQE